MRKGLSGGKRFGPPPKKGPNSQVPPIKLSYNQKENGKKIKNKTKTV